MPGRLVGLGPRGASGLNGGAIGPRLRGTRLAGGGDVVRKVGEYVTRRIGDETLVVPIRAKAAELDHIYVLNDVAVLIWNQLESAQPDEIAQAIAADFDVSLDVARRDVDRFLVGLCEAGVVEGQVG
jgi:hypothetical protein